eukprot:s1303_g16.t1
MKEMVDLTKGEASYAKFMKGRHEERTKRLAALQAMKAAREEAHQQEAKVEEATEKEDEVELHVVQTGKPKEKTMAKKPRRRRTGTIKGKRWYKRSKITQRMVRVNYSPRPSTESSGTPGTPTDEAQRGQPAASAPSRISPTRGMDNRMEHLQKEADIAKRKLAYKEADIAKRKLAYKEVEKKKAAVHERAERERQRHLREIAKAKEERKKKEQKVDLKPRDDEDEPEEGDFNPESTIILIPASRVGGRFFPESEDPSFLRVLPRAKAMVKMGYPTSMSKARLQEQRKENEDHRPQHGRRQDIGRDEEWPPELKKMAQWEAIRNVEAAAALEGAGEIPQTMMADLLTVATEAIHTVETAEAPEPGRPQAGVSTGAGPMLSISEDSSTATSSADPTPGMSVNEWVAAGKGKGKWPPMSSAEVQEFWAAKGKGKKGRMGRSWERQRKMASNVIC